MFDAKDLSALDPKYFSIIFTDAFDVTVMSRNTGHYWFIHNPEYPTPGTCIIFHKHRASHAVTHEDMTYEKEQHYNCSEYSDYGLIQRYR